MARDTSSARAAATKALRTRSTARKDVLAGILRDPPEDFDGSNTMLGRYMNLSSRTVARLISALEAEGRLERRSKFSSFPNGFSKTRFLKLKE